MTEVLLGLFVPWKDLAPLFLRHATHLNPSTHVWTAVEPTLPAHIRDFTKNVELLRKSKQDCQQLRSAVNQVADDFGRDVDELDQTVFESGDEGEPSITDHVNVNVETLIVAYHSIRNTWHQETSVSAQRIPSLIGGTTLTQNAQLSNLLPIEASNLQTSDLHFFLPSILDLWESQLKNARKLDEEENATQDSTMSRFDVDDFDLEKGNNDSTSFQ
jgi:hypothetical protein